MEMIAGIFENIGLDYFMRGRFRPGYFFGTIILSSAVLLGFLAYGFACISMHCGLLALLVCSMVGLFGGLMVVRQDLQDQNAGLIPGLGDWWEGFSNNRLSNNVTEDLIFGSMVVVGTLFAMVLTDPGDSFIRKNMPYVVNAFEKPAARTTTKTTTKTTAKTKTKTTTKTTTAHYVTDARKVVVSKHKQVGKSPCSTHHGLNANSGHHVANAADAH